MLWLQLAILVLVACVQGGDAQDGSAATGCQLKCSQKGGKCVDSPKDCSGQLISNMKCPAEGATCNCCLASGAGKGGRVVKNKKTASANRKGDSSQKSKKKTKKLGASNKDGKGGKGVKRKGDSNKKSKKKNKKLGASNKDGSSKTKSDKGKSDGKVKKNKKNKQKTKKKGSKKRKIPKKGSKKSGRKIQKDGPKKKSKQQKKGKGRKGGKGKGSNNKEKTGTQGDDAEQCVTKCVDGKTCVTNEMICDKVKDCGNDDDTDEKGCNFAKDLKCNRCKTWDTGDVGAKFDSECGTDKNSGHIDNADPEDPYIGCATKVYKNGDVLRLFESYQINAEQGNCYEGTDAENGGPEYQYTRCWCEGDNCNTNLCEQCVKGAAPEK